MTPATPRQRGANSVEPRDGTLLRWDLDRARATASTCADLIGRLKASLDGDPPAIEHDRFRADVTELRRVTSRLVTDCQDVDRRLSECGVHYEYRWGGLDDGGHSAGYCTLPAGHNGHHGGPDTDSGSVGDNVLDVANQLADVGENIGWLAPTIDQHLGSDHHYSRAYLPGRPNRGELPATIRDQLEQLAYRLLDGADQTNQLAKHVVELGPDHDDHYWPHLDADDQARDLADDAAEKIRQRLDHVAAKRPSDPNQLGLL